MEGCGENRYGVGGSKEMVRVCGREEEWRVSGGGRKVARTWVNKEWSVYVDRERCLRVGGGEGEKILRVRGWERNVARTWRGKECHTHVDEEGMWRVRGGGVWLPSVAWHGRRLVRRIGGTLGVPCSGK